MTIENEIKKSKNRVFRRAYIKRRDSTTGQFEANWQEITEDVEKWGIIRKSIDDVRQSKFTFESVSLRMSNDTGRYNPEDDENSLWNGYANRERSLLKIEAGFLNASLTNGIWTRTEFPSSKVAFTGLVSGDSMVNDTNSVNLKIKPLTQVFRDFPATKLTGFTSTGITASKFIEILRDMTDGSSNYIFRPFFNNTSTGFIYTLTSIVYGNLNTNTAEDLVNKNCWEIIESLAEAENFAPYADQNGNFVFKAKTENTTTSKFHFIGGNGNFDTTYGHTIKTINSYGKKIKNLYTRVEVHWKNTSTSDAFSVAEATLAVSGASDFWNYGYRTFKMENFFIQTSTVANTIAATIYNDFSTLRNEIAFTSSFVPHVQVLDKVEVTYDSTDKNIASRWDLSDWAPSVERELIWDDSEGDAIRLVQKEFKILSVDLNLDRIESTFKAREL